jgi:hypothetical protein
VIAKFPHFNRFSRRGSEKNGGGREAEGGGQKKLVRIIFWQFFIK